MIGDRIKICERAENAQWRVATGGWIDAANFVTVGDNEFVEGGARGGCFDIGDGAVGAIDDA